MKTQRLKQAHKNDKRKKPKKEKNHFSQVNDGAQDKKELAH